MKTTARVATELALLVLALALLISHTSIGADLTIELRSQEVREPAAVAVIHFSRPDAVEVESPDSVTCRIPGSAVVSLPGSGTWHIKAEAPGYWAPIQAISTNSRESLPVTIELFPSTPLRGLISSPKGFSVPSSADLRITGAFSGLHSENATTVKCPITKQQFVCSIPVTDIDVRLRVEGAGPVYFWGLNPTNDKPVDLGTIELRPGGAVTGRIEFAERVPNPNACKVTVRPEIAQQPGDRKTADRIKGLAFNTRPDDKGRFQVSGLAPGRYLVTASLEGFAPTVFGPFEVRQGLASEIPGRLLISRPVTALVQIFPPLAPNGERWFVQLAREYVPGTSLPGAAREGRSDQDGAWMVRGLTTGAYRLTVSGSDGARWATTNVEVGDKRNEFQVDVQLIAVEGTVTSGDEPVAGTLIFGGRSGPRTIPMVVDHAGRFLGYLPSDGKWPVDFAGDDDYVPLDDVDVQVEPRSQKAHLTILIPRPSVTGEVVDEKSQPFPGAEVRVYYGPHLATARAGEGGRFRVTGVPVGPAVVEARAGDLASSKTDYLVSEDDHSDLTLVLKDRREIEGRVVGPSGGVAGARVMAMPLTAGELSNTASGPDGAFTLRVPPNVQQAVLLAYSPGFAVRIMHVTFEEEAALIVPLGSETGTIVLDLKGLDAARLKLSHAGVTIPVGLLPIILGQSHSNPERPRFQSMPPGNYTVCAGATCASTLLAPGVEAVISLSE